MDVSKWHISTIAPDAPELARKYGLGLEIAEYCTAYNMDERFAQTDPVVREKLAVTDGRTFHAPFNELFPCAIDPKARLLARERYLQAASLAVDYGADRLVIHGGYQPQMYYPIWYIEQSAPFWRELMERMPEGMTVCLENVFEPEPGMLLEIVKNVAHPRLGVCLDVGHINAYSHVPALEWLEACGEYVNHFHIHNNSGDHDSHSGITEGTLDIFGIVDAAERLCPRATMALEVLEAAPSVRALMEHYRND